MPQHIDYTGKSERDLLIELVVQGNSQCEQNDRIIKHLATLNGSVAKHEQRLTTLESQVSERTVPAWMASKWKAAGVGTLAVSVATALAIALAEFIKCYWG